MPAWQRVTLSLLAVALGATGAERTAFSWQKPQAKVLPTGGLEWAPEPFVFAPGKTVRYIDFAAGSDANDGASKERPWKHHPWDPAAANLAKAHRGPTTYVFKRGVVYRGQLAAPADDQGTPGEPIRLTSDPAWGAGEAVLCGSEAVAGWKQGADHKDIPESQKVWWTDLAFAPRCVWMLEAGKAIRLKLARTPNWTVSDPDDVKSEWWTWEQPRWWTQQNKTTVNGRKMHLGVDTKHLTKPADHYRDAILRTEWGIVMGTPFPTKVEAVDAAKKSVAFQGVWWGDSGTLITNNRYYLEDKPHYLDEPGEFWFDKKGAGGRLYVRLPGDRDPNTMAVEAARRYCLIEDAASAAAPPRTDVLKPEQRDKLLTTGLRHVEITGLTFRFTNTWWDLEFPAWMHKEVDNACIRALGSADGLRVSHCRFEHVAKAVRVEPINAQCRIGSVVVSDNDIAHLDAEAITIAKGQGQLGSVEVLRNRLAGIGLRPRRQAHGHAVEVGFPQTAEVAGNILDRCYGAGLFIFGGKGSGQSGDAPLSRILIHHNQVTDPLLNTNDWGGIETWQGGPFYVYCNVSGNPGGYWHWAYGPKKPASARFGHAYYLDGSFKNYVFNNIAWGKSKDPFSRLGNTAAFQEIISFENAFFNNTVYNFVKGTRRQAPHAGRDKFLGNVWSGIGEWLFWHAEPAKSEPEGNAADAGPQKEHFAHETNAYARNVFHDVSDRFAVFEPSGRWHASLDSFRKALAERGALASDVGQMSEKPVLRDPAKHDFRLAPGSAAVDAGVRVFVPWGLYAPVGEWHFTRHQKDPTEVIDEHWYMTPYYGKREDYWKTPRYPLTGVNVRAGDYIDGPLEDWTQGALRLNGKDQHLVLSHAELASPVGGGSGQEKRTVDIGEGSFLIEVYFRTEPGHTGGVLVSKIAERGYALSLDGDGRLAFLVRGDAAASAGTRDRVNDGRWHHVVAECDRAAATLRVYLDGATAAEARGARLGGSLANGADFLVGKGATGAYFAGAMDFLRVCRGTLADAKTTIEELYAWEFGGPQHRDFCGRRPAGKGRDAGALELTP
ncbi:MAG TPA: LamG domain-containing protein [Planctomycetota bacterium]|nr:LamG domain-containing protein [Planctomycetota bacterium]HRT94393.1 LamG domain-containing protein [Planctomycetota bacterium]